MNLELQNIALNQGELFPTNITFELIDGAITNDYTYTVHFREIAEDKTLQYPAFGNGTYEINTQSSASPQNRPSAANDVDKIIKGHYAVYPNPTHDNISVVYDREQQNVALQLVDLTGRVLYTTESKVDLEPTQLSLSELPSGIYILVIKDKTGLVEKFKIVKQ